MQDFDLVIVGAGVAGLTAAMVAGRHGLKVAVIDQLGVGGQIINAERIENFPGLPQAIAGHQLGPLLHEQAEAGGAQFFLDTITAVEPGNPHIVRGAAEMFRAPALIIAAGSALRSLGIAGEERLLGRGVSHCASCDGPFFKGQQVGVVGGGDAALDEALVLAEHAARVTNFHRGATLRAQAALLARVRTDARIAIALNTVVEEILGEEAVAAVRLRDVTNGATRIENLKAVFVYVGLEPNTAFLRSALRLDPTGHIETDAMMRTSVAGIFAAGDIRTNSVAQLAAVAGDGATAAVASYRYLKTRA